MRVFSLLVVIGVLATYAFFDFAKRLLCLGFSYCLCCLRSTLEVILLWGLGLLYFFGVLLTSAYVFYLVPISQSASVHGNKSF